MVPTETFELYFAFERTEGDPAGDVTSGASRGSLGFSVLAVAVLLKLSVSKQSRIAVMFLLKPHLVAGGASANIVTSHHVSRWLQ